LLSSFCLRLRILFSHSFLLSECVSTDLTDPRRGVGCLGGLIPNIFSATSASPRFLSISSQIFIESHRPWRERTWLSHPSQVVRFFRIRQGRMEGRWSSPARSARSFARRWFFCFFRRNGRAPAPCVLSRPPILSLLRIPFLFGFYPGRVSLHRTRVYSALPPSTYRPCPRVSSNSV